MTNALILHGKPKKETYFNRDIPSASNAIWMPWLQQELLLLGIPTQTPEMFNAWQPDYKLWSSELERYDVHSDTLLIGHSMGAGFIVQWLSEHTDVSVRHIFLVGPSLGDKFTPEETFDDPPIGGFFEFEIDPALSKRAKSITIFHSDNDNQRVNSAVQYIQEKIPSVEYQKFHNYGHFRGKRDMPSDTFPELLEAISKNIN